MQEVRVLATCSLGLGFSYKGLEAGLERAPHLIACDAGSSDFGPYYLGAGKLQKSPLSLKRDLALLIGGARRIGVPFITGSAGGAGGGPHLAAMVDLVREIAREEGLSFRLAVIPAEIPAETVKARLRDGRIEPVGRVEPLTDAAVDRSAAIVGMMGAEPFIRALELGADVIIAGRATDPAIFAGVGLRAGLDPGPVWHAAKCIDKGYLATTRPQDGSPVLATIRNDHFTIEPTRDQSFCTVSTVANITLHENPDPFFVAQPTGAIDSSEAVYEQVDERTVRVSGSRYRPAARPTIKLEGAELVGHRNILIAGIRDPRLISRMDEFLTRYRQSLAQSARSMGISESDYELQFRVYGKDAVMGAYEPVQTPSHELGLIVDMVGRTPEISGAIATRLGPTGSRLDIFGGMGGGGNFAYPFSPSKIEVGPAYAWNIWHLMQVSEAELTDLFPVQIVEV
ncbi:MAG: acyclic terpene utilization AtuA family protein [Phenylobacterium sp.]|nr:acyclic terpene utilization AtuA family protein [Phenylobacterium sp.]